MKSFFTDEYLLFFKELAEDNSKVWFDANKARYEKKVKAPFLSFLQTFVAEIKAINPNINANINDCTFRINRDIRFSPDKSPYKTYLSGLVSVRGKKDKCYPGFYFELGAKGILVFAGVYMLEKAHLAEIRKEIAYFEDKYKQIIEDKEFVSCYQGQVKGLNGKLEDDFLKEKAKSMPVLKQKQFYVETSLSEELIASPQLLPEMLRYYKASLPLIQFLETPFLEGETKR